MKISVNTIRTVNQIYGSAADPAPNGVDDLVRKIGDQLGAVEEVISFGDRFEGVLVVRVISCEDHPNADRLHVCKIDDGGAAEGLERDENGHVQVVCGAPNVRPGLTVAWLPPGSTVPNTAGKDPFVLEARALRGAISNGMLASPKELSIGDSHEGIMELDDAIAPGTAFADAYHLRGEAIIDIENKMFTHRPDCFGQLGVAREIAGIYGQPFKSPEWYQANPEIPGIEADELKLEARNELPELVPRFTAIAMRDVTFKPSPVWLQIYLASVGLRPINNIVDYTNFFMMETGQPIHAYDYDKVKSLSDADHAVMVVRHPKQGETITLLNGKTVAPRSEAMMVATDKQLICVGGAMGGADTEVDENTKNLIIEAANWDMFNIRKTSMEHGIFTDAVTRFNKGQSPLQNKAVLAKIVDEIRRYADGKVASPLIDDSHVPAEAQERNSLYVPVTLTVQFINERLGLKLSIDEISTLLTNVEFAVERQNDGLTITAPFWRTDIAIPEDIVEEVGRLYGYDHLPLELPMRNLTPAQRDPLLEIKQQVRIILARGGANEVLGYSFVHGNLLLRTGQDATQAFQLSNAISPDLQYFRMSLMPSLLDKVHPNIKAGHDHFGLFEIGKAHNRGKEVQSEDAAEHGLPAEFERVAYVVAANDKAGKTLRGAAYYQAKKQLEVLLSALGIADDVHFKLLEDSDDGIPTAYYQPGRAASVYIADTLIGWIGEYKIAVRKGLKLPEYCAGFELDVEALLSRLDGKSRYRPLPKFPKVTQDICLRVPAKLAYGELFRFVSDHLHQNRPGGTYYTLTPVDIYQREGDDRKQVTLRLATASYERTLTDDEVNRLLEGVAAVAKDAFDAERV
jgi:phenylalanyl-tRNA synthetase beta chain